MSEIVRLHAVETEGDRACIARKLRDMADLVEAMEQTPTAFGVCVFHTALWAEKTGAEADWLSPYPFSIFANAVKDELMAAGLRARLGGDA